MAIKYQEYQGISLLSCPLLSKGEKGQFSVNLEFDQSLNFHGIEYLLLNLRKDNSLTSFYTFPRQERNRYMSKMQ